MNLVQLCNPAYEHKTEIELFRLAQRNSITGVAAPVAVPALILIGFGKTLDQHSLTIWLSLIICTFVMGLLTYWLLHPKDKDALPDRQLLHRWRQINLIYLIFAGLAWGSLSILFDTEHDTQNAGLLLTYIAVLTSGGSTSAVHSFRAYFVAVAVSMGIVQWHLPIAFREQTMPIALLLLIYPLFVARVSRNAQQTILHSIQLQFLNEKLLKEKEIAAQQAERERIYRDLHDDVGAKLLGLAISAQRANQPREADLARSALQDLRDVVSRSAHSVSRMDALLADWRAETAQRVQSAGVALDWRIPVDEQPLVVSAAAALNLSRILRESVTNVLRHAKATHISVDLSWQEERLRFTIQDDGVGLPESGVKGNRGMSSMRARAAALGGSIEWHSVAPNGCMVVIEVSLPHLAPDATASFPA